jgi:hypothetical protein
MTKQTINKRLDQLENKHQERPMIPIFQDLDDPDLWHPGGRDAEPISWDQVEADYSDYLVIKVVYKNIEYND